MNVHQIQAVVLAAGASTRFGTAKSKLAHTICGKELLAYPLEVLKTLNIPTIAVLGHQKDVIETIVKKHAPSSLIVEQREQKGTGHAVHQSKALWHGNNIFILNGDMPLVSQELLEKVIKTHTLHKATITLVTAHYQDPHHGYGRIIETGSSIKIVEAKEFTGDTAAACCINAGIYLIKKDFLESSIEQLSAHGNEYYITDLIDIASKQKLIIKTVDAPFDTIRGVNTLKELWIAEQLKKSQIIEHWMNNGVRFVSPQTVHIDATAIIESNTVIESGVQLRGQTHIGQFCHINAGSIITNSTLKEHVIVHPYTIISDSIIDTSSNVGPFAHVRSHSVLASQTVIGNFVEIAKSTLGPKTKAKHLSYLGNAEIGAEVNIGAGTITCNYNGISKHTTRIEHKAFIGTNTSLVAPVTIGAESIIAAGSTITKDVPKQALAIGRSHQVNKLEYAPKLREKYEIAKHPQAQTQKVYNQKEGA